MTRERRPRTATERVVEALESIWDAVENLVGFVVVVFSPGVAAVLWMMLVYVLGIIDPLGYWYFTPEGPGSGRMGLQNGLVFLGAGWILAGLVWYGNRWIRLVIGLLATDIFAMYVLTVAFGPIARVLFGLSLGAGLIAVVALRRESRRRTVAPVTWTGER